MFPHFMFPNGREHNDLQRGPSAKVLLDSVSGHFNLPGPPKSGEGRQIALPHRRVTYFVAGILARI